MNHPVFVYGTLRRNLDNHHFLRGSAFLGPGRTSERYALYVGGLIPYVRQDEPLYPVRGELYLVDDATLAALDRLEGHPSCYVRRQVPVILDGGERHTAWLYFHDRPNGLRMPTGDFRDTPGIF